MSIAGQLDLAHFAEISMQLRPYHLHISVQEQYYKRTVSLARGLYQVKKYLIIMTSSTDTSYPQSQQIRLHQRLD